jgi:predicted nuclease of predicted toxin-antitoxin system
MRILLDECLPKDLARELPGHEVTTVPQAGWASISNGKLLRLIADSGKFDLFLTVDKRLPQQNKTSALPFAIVVLRAKSNRMSAWQLELLTVPDAGLNSYLYESTNLDCLYCTGGDSDWSGDGCISRSGHLSGA